VIPNLGTALASVAAGLALGTVAAAAAAALRARGVPVAYTRKVFHFGVFSGAAGIHALGGLGATNAYGAAVAALVLRALFAGPAHPLFRALARPRDEPRQALFIFVPLVTTAVGGLASGLLAGSFATVGYLVAGWGDAVGEPVGARWGRHTYRVPSLAGVAAVRSWEGTGAVLVMSWAAAGTALLGLGVPWPRAAAVAGAVGAVTAVVEAVSHHGTDNLTVQLAASLVARTLAG
jgi:phytol kinase